jgi:hypothetical protein
MLALSCDDGASVLLLTSLPLTAFSSPLRKPATNPSGKQWNRHDEVGLGLDKSGIPAFGCCVVDVVVVVVVNPTEDAHFRIPMLNGLTAKTPMKTIRQRKQG